MKLFFRKLGEGKPLVVLHGLFGSSDNWLTISKKLANDFTVYLLDLRNHGQSPHHEIHDYEAMTEDLHEFFSDLNLDSASILGHSMGGKVAMRFAFQYPEKVSKLIVADISPRDYRTSNKYIVESLLSIDLGTIKTREDADKALSEKIPNKAIRLFILKNLFRNNDLSFSWRLNLAALNLNLNSMGGDFDKNNGFTKETLFFKGEKSNYILPSDFELIKKAFPNSTIDIVEDAGHWLHTEKPDYIYQKLKSFLG